MTAEASPIADAGEDAVAIAEQTHASAGWLTDLWYLAMPAKALRPGEMRGKVFMQQPVLLARDKSGRPYALADLCPHRGVQLSAGKFDGEVFRCPYHGWRFGTDGVCRAIPSLLPDQHIDLSKIRVRTYPCREVQGNLWVYLSERAPAAGADLGAPFAIPDIGDLAPKVTVPLTFETDLDEAIYGLLDPAHTPYVHEGPLWRRPDVLREKSKAYVPSPLGFTMVRHEPSSNSVIYKLLGGKPTTEITFQLPGVRVEHIRIGKHHICNLTAMTPVSADRTEVTNCLYWTSPVLDLLRPAVASYARKFLGQDQWVVSLRDKACVPDPPKMLINDADALQKWYLRLKREWRRVQREGDEFVNPVRPATLRWRT